MEKCKIIRLITLSSLQNKCYNHESFELLPPQVLDMCAAPGSKTAQLVEALHVNGDVVPGLACFSILSIEYP